MDDEAAGGSGLVGGFVVPDYGFEGEEALVDAAADALGFPAGGGERTPATAGAVLWSGEYRVGNDVEIVVNAALLGLYPDAVARLPIITDSFASRKAVVDVVSNPPRTWLLRNVEARGSTMLDGAAMLVNQGVLGIEPWTGIGVDAGVMRSELERVFNAHSVAGSH